MPLSLLPKSMTPAPQTPPPGPPGDPVRRQLRGLLWPLGLLTAGGVAIIAVLLLFAAREQNELALEASRHLAASAVGTEVSRVAGNVRDYATWDDTVLNVVISLDEDWAAENIGIWAYEGLQLDVTLVADGQDEIFYAMVEGERSGAEVRARLGDSLGPLIAAARQAETTSVGAAFTGFVRLDGEIAIAAAAPIIWEDGRAAPDRGGAPSVLVYLRRFDEEILTELEEGFLLPDLRVVDAVTAASAGGGAVPLRGHAGEILGYLTWQAEQPGFLMLRPLLLPGALAALLGGLLLWLVIGRASKAMHELEISHAVLREHAEALRLARDRAERHSRTEEDLRRRADAASRSKSEFLALVSHELRTPLNAILGFSETIATQAFGPAATERYREYARDIHESGAHLLSIINDILDLTKIEARRYELHEEQIDLGPLLERCCALLRERASGKGVTLACTRSELSLRADARALKQIVINLLTNAIKFTESGGRVDLSAALTAEGVEISVADSGIGMNEEDLARALQPFGQAASALTRSEEGTGLGLNITQALAELHSGRLELRSARGQGTTAIIRLPLKRLASAELPDRSIAQ